MLSPELPSRKRRVRRRRSLGKTLGVVSLVYGEPTISYIIEGLGEICHRVKTGQCQPFKLGRVFLLKFPYQGGLKFAVSQSVLHRKHNKGGFRVRRWSGEENTVPYSFPRTTWLKVEGLPMHCWDWEAFSKAVGNFANLLEVDETTLSLKHLATARVKVGCDL